MIARRPDRTALPPLPFLALLGALTLLLAFLLGCARPAGPPPIAVGTPCALCGMEVEDLRFGCERSDGKAWRVYDAIECLLRELHAAPETTVWLADYDSQTLHRADSLWVVKGDFASPMGGGFAAFLDRAAADRVAGETRGRVARLGTFSGATP
jgi:nitrous oxide reductase accessory protein NosL